MLQRRIEGPIRTDLPALTQLCQQGMCSMGSLIEASPSQEDVCPLLSEWNRSRSGECLVRLLGGGGRSNTANAHRVDRERFSRQVKIMCWPCPPSPLALLALWPPVQHGLRSTALGEADRRCRGRPSCTGKQDTYYLLDFSSLWSWQRQVRAPGALPGRAQAVAPSGLAGKQVFSPAGCRGRAFRCGEGWGLLQSGSRAPSFRDPSRLTESAWGAAECPKVSPGLRSPKWLLVQC